MIQNKRKGSFSKSGNGSQQLNELMLRYAQANQVSKVAACLIKGADVDFQQGAALKIAVWFSYIKLLKILLKARPQIILEACAHAESASNHVALELLNEYRSKFNI